MTNNLFDLHPSELTPEQSRLSKAMSTFADTMEQKVFGVTSKLNSTQTTQTEHFEYEAADYVVKVVRGDVIEKVWFYENRCKEGNAPHDAGTTGEPIHTNRHLSQHATCRHASHCHELFIQQGWQ